EFDGMSELHTGVSNTSGVVYNYTQGGVVRDQTGWERCVSVPLVRPDMFPLLAQWDRYLDQFSDGPMWDPAWHRFDEQHHNCFSFCLGFINSVLALEGRDSVSRETFTETFILPRMRRLTKYTALCRHLQRHQYYLVDRQPGPAASPDLVDRQPGLAASPDLVPDLVDVQPVPAATPDMF
ncbi:MKRN2 opposite strand protein-like, partial [Etheostoma cragini]|uniref:MKRN2 opposite strand protein-like n=1 Tax=Etheostoma cragini TaxID=417921 RepID=UPI00155E6FAA